MHGDVPAYGLWFLAFVNAGVFLSAFMAPAL